MTSKFGTWNVKNVAGRWESPFTWDKVENRRIWQRASSHRLDYTGILDTFAFLSQFWFHPR